MYWISWLSLLMTWGVFVFNDKFHCTLTEAYYKMITGTNLSSAAINSFWIGLINLVIQALFHLFILPPMFSGVSHDSYPDVCNSTHLSSQRKPAHVLVCSSVPEYFPSLHEILKFDLIPLLHPPPNHHNKTKYIAWPFSNFKRNKLRLGRWLSG